MLAFLGRFGKGFGTITGIVTTIIGVATHPDSVVAAVQAIASHGSAIVAAAGVILAAFGFGRKTGDAAAKTP